MAKKAGKRKAASPRRKSPARAKAGARKSARASALGRGRRKAPVAAARKKSARRGGTSRKRLAKTPRAGRAVKRRTTPTPTRRSTATPAGEVSTRRAPGLDRARRRLREVEENVPTPPSSLDPDRRWPSAARSGRKEMKEALTEHNEVSPEITAGDVDADWEDAYAVGDEAPGGDNPTPDQDRVDDIGKALGVEYEDNEELKASDKIAKRDRKRWELDPASSEDYQDRD